MVDVKATNLKLKQRAKGIIREICGSGSSTSDGELTELLQSCGGSVKLAIVAHRLQIPVSEAKNRLQAAGGVLSDVFKEQEGSAPKTFDEDDHVKYVLCVDGGGSKCAAFVLGSNGEAGSATTAGCNV